MTICSAAGRLVFDWTCLTKDGTRIPVEIHDNLITLESIPYVIASIRDMRQRVAMESSLEQTHLRYKTLLNAVPDAIVVHRDGIVHYVNESAKKMLALTSREAAEGVHLNKFLNPKSRDRAAARHGELLRRGAEGEVLLPVEHEVVRADGTTFLAESRSLLIADENRRHVVMTITRDVTETHRLSAELRIMAYQDPLTSVDRPAQSPLFLRTPGGDAAGTLGARNPACRDVVRSRPV